jgi:hypothetical protein
MRDMRTIKMHVPCNFYMYSLSTLKIINFIIGLMVIR